MDVVTNMRNEKHYYNNTEEAYGPVSLGPPNAESVAMPPQEKTYFLVLSCLRGSLRSWTSSYAYIIFG